MDNQDQPNQANQLVPSSQQSPNQMPEIEAKPIEPEQVLVRWSAPEFTYTNKPMGWYLLLGLFFIGLIILAVVIRQWMTIALFAVMWVALAVYARRKPRVLNYMITNHGVRIGEKNYNYDKFTSYSESDDYGAKVFDLLPKKRIAPMVSLPIPQGLDDKVDQFLVKFLPKTERKKDSIDKFSQYLKF